MSVNAPVYIDRTGTHFINIFAEDEDGTFARTNDEPMRMLRDDIKGVSIPQGELLSNKSDRVDREWSTPTIIFHYGRPQSFYQFLRDKVARNKFYVFCKPDLSGRISKFALHELNLKPNISQRKLAMFKEKYIEALSLWSEQQHQKNTNLLNQAKAKQEVAKKEAGNKRNSSVQHRRVLTDKQYSGKKRVKLITLNTRGAKQSVEENKLPEQSEKVSNSVEAEVTRQQFESMKTQVLTKITMPKKNERSIENDPTQIIDPLDRNIVKSKKRRSKFLDRFIYGRK